MGVTIHFEGRLKTNEDFDAVMKRAREFANEHSSGIVSLDSDRKLLKRVKDEKDWDYEGAVRGIQIQPHENSDPLILEFGKDLYIQEYCKTQFAGVQVHISIVEFLRSIEPFFEKLSVVDEGEFWDTNDIKIVEGKFKDFFAAFESAIRENPKLKGPFRMRDGRIVDLMHDV
jgi:hypothetical protein